VYVLHHTKIYLIHYIYSRIEKINGNKAARPNPILLSWAAPEVLVVCAPEFVGVEVTDGPLPPAFVDVPEGEELTMFVLKTDEVPEAEVRTLSAPEADEPEVKEATPLV
jgi:hypothetical protein